ncbi:MAG: choice-of-anchor Q domain-containing protein, partial [Anaerolineales bacterium]
MMIGIAVGLAAAGLWLLVLTPPPAQGAPGAAPIVVNSVADFPDAQPGDGACETVISNTICTLRAAIMEANARPGADVIRLQANTTYPLNRPAQGNSALFGQMDFTDSLGGDLDITDSVTLLGGGADGTIIDGNGGATGDRVFQITGTVVISGVTIEHGQGHNIGGGLISYGRLTLINSVIYSNTALNINNWGGGIYNSGPLTMTHSRVLSNATGTSNAYGGGMYNQGLLQIVDSVFAGNTTGGSPGYGGGLFAVGYTATVVNSTFSDNTGVLGGGIYQSGYPLSVINSTLSGNHSTGNGGGLYAAAGSTSLYNVTITQNIANSDNSGGGEGGGVAHAASGALTFLNSIIAHNFVIITMHPFPLIHDDDCTGSIISQGYNLLYAVNTNYCSVSGSYGPGDPLLGPLQDNGGPTATHALLPGSPAIDGGNPGGCTDNIGAQIVTDQRGRRRGAPCDIGAFEFPYLL